MSSRALEQESQEVMLARSASAPMLPGVNLQYTIHLSSGLLMLKQSENVIVKLWTAGQSYA